MSTESQNNSFDKLLGKRFGKVRSLAIPSLVPAAESLAKQFSTLDTLKIISPPFKVDGLSALVERQQDFQSWAKFVFSWLAPLRDLSQTLALLRFPKNLTTAFEELSKDEVAGFVLSQGIGVYGAPRASILVKLVRSDNTAERRKLLNNYSEQIVDDCEKVVSSENVKSRVPESEFALEAIKCIKDGYPKSAQALLTVLLDSLIFRLTPDESTRRKITNHRVDSDPPIKLESEGLRHVLAWLPVWNAHKTFRPYTGDKLPREFNRHASVHYVRNRQYSKRNCMQALLLTTGVIKYAASSSRDEWGVIDPSTPVKNLKSASSSA